MTQLSEEQEALGMFATAYVSYVEVKIDHALDSEGTDDDFDKRVAKIKSFEDLIHKGADEIGLQDDYLISVANGTVEMHLATIGHYKNGDPVTPDETVQQYFDTVGEKGNDPVRPHAILSGALAYIVMTLAKTEAELRHAEMELMKHQISQMLGPDLANAMFGGEEGDDDMPSVFGPFNDDNEGVDPFGF
jgi:hypothetical protein